MSEKKNTELHEPITHTTGVAPYGIYHTRQSIGYEPALYLHWHDEMEFFLLESGDLHFQIENTSYTLHAGDIVFVPPGALHSACRLSETRVISHAFVFSTDVIASSFDVHFYNKYILPLMHNNLPLAFKLDKDIPWHQTVKEYLCNIIYTEEPSGIFVRGLTFLIWDLVYRYHISKSNINKAQSDLSEQLAPALSFIHDNYSQNITLKDMAACVYLSESEFCRTFKLLTGMTAFHYLIRYRILQSCSDLSQTNKKIADIALSNGFNNISYYNRAFIKLMHMTPSEYRKRNYKKDK